MSIFNSFHLRVKLALISFFYRGLLDEQVQRQIQDAYKNKEYDKIDVTFLDVVFVKR